MDHYMCDLQPLLKLACADTYVTNLLLVSNSGAICTVSFVMLMVSYVIILYSLRNHSAEGRKKALSTCISHIMVVILFFGPCIFIYTRPATTFSMDKIITVFIQLEPLCSTLWFIHWGMQKWKMPWGCYGVRSWFQMTKDEWKFFKFFFIVWVDLERIHRDCYPFIVQWIQFCLSNWNICTDEHWVNLV